MKNTLTSEEIREMKASLKKDKSGKYVFNNWKPYGSIENPMVVGMPDCSDTLVYDKDRGCWILTDGLGNGYIR